MEWLLCKVFGHKYHFIKSLSRQSDMIGCKRCRKRFAMNHSVRCILEWDRELEKFYEEFHDLTKTKPAKP